MKKEEILKEIDDLEMKSFILDMKDMWDEDDYKINLLYQSVIILRDSLYQYFKENGINILPANKQLLRLKLEPKEIKLLCTREISREEWYV